MAVSARVARPSGMIERHEQRRIRPTDRGRRVATLRTADVLT
jgi:hypothetical protein